MAQDKEMYEGFDFAYDEAAANKADSAADRLTESGLYLVKFKCVSPFKTDEGAVGIQFDAELLEGGSTNFGLFVRSKEGKETFGMQNFQGMRTIFGLKTAARPVKGKVRAYNKEEKTWEDVDGPVYADMCDKPIYVVLQKEFYTKKDGKDSFRFGLVTVASAESKKTPKEINTNAKSATRLAKIMSTLTDRDNRKAKTKQSDADLGISDDDTAGI